MTPEVYWLMLTLLLTGLMAFPYVVDRMRVRGLWNAMTGPVHDPARPQSPWALRAMAAHKNAIENLVVFAPAVLALTSLQISTPTTRVAALAYFWARAVHYLVYTAGIPVARTLAFLVGAVATLVIIVSVFGWL